MPPDLDEYWQCQICYQHFPSDKELRRHIEAFQSRVQHLFAELQKCFAHSDLKPPDGEDCGSSSSADNLINDNGDGHEMLLCPHEECDSKLRTSFKTWKSLVTHYTIHVKCCETCRFCGLEIDRVRKYVTHIDSCKTKMKDQRSPEFLSANRITIKQRRILRKKASKELKLKMSTIADASDEEATSQGAHSRKRGREVADPDPENLRQSRKQRIARDGNGDSTVAISSDSPYQVSGADGVSRGTGLSFAQQKSSNFSHRNSNTCSF
ncbi:hypothetical protein B0O99DRAFT_340506 [Bisporella sp. PMI_857]|nr:hypothetical protein B0O99DRAFT_340506 [Bisporella sp. PMI_857]